MAAEIFMAKEGAAVDAPGGTIYIVAGKTTVRAGHPLLAAHPTLFEPIHVDFDVAEPAPEKEEKEEARTTIETRSAVSSSRADTQGARSRAASK